MSDGPTANSTEPPRGLRYSFRTLLLALLAAALLAGAARMYLLTALTARGMLVAGIMMVVGTTVGRVVGEAGSRTPQLVLLAVCMTFYAALASGRTSPGEPLLMWAFLCASGGMMLGILFPAPSWNSA